MYHIIYLDLIELFEISESENGRWLKLVKIIETTTIRAIVEQRKRMNSDQIITALKVIRWKDPTKEIGMLIMNNKIEVKALVSFCDIIIINERDQTKRNQIFH